MEDEETDKGLISKLHKQLIQLNTKNQTTQWKKMDGRLKQTFLQKRHIDGQQVHEKMFNITNH